MNQKWKWLSFCAFIAMFVTACVPDIPEEINMAEHEGHHSNGPTTSCVDLKEAKAKGPIKKFHLTAKSVDLQLDNEKTQDNTWTFNGSTPGPEIRVREGDRLVVKLTNQDIQDGVTIHWHGVILPCSQDGVAGVTQEAVKPGETFTYEFIAKHPGTFWYHSHQQSSVQAKKGLIGRFIVEPKVKKYNYERDYAITLQHLANRYYLINQKSNQIHLNAKSGENVRLRIANSTNKTQMMKLSGVPFRAISIDGNDIFGPEPIQNQRLPIGAGGRYDVLFQMPSAGKVQLKSESEDRLPPVTLGEGDVLTDSHQNETTFDFTNYGTAKDDGISLRSKFIKTHVLELDETIFGGYTINGKMAHEIPPIMVKQGDLVKIRLVNQGDETHPMHLHGHSFKVLSKNGNAVKSPIYLDTLPVNAGETYEIAFKADNPGLWMTHCHNLPHAASGMSMMVNYEGISTPFTVGTKSGNIPD